MIFNLFLIPNQRYFFFFLLEQIKCDISFPLRMFFHCITLIVSILIADKEFNARKQKNKLVRDEFCCGEKKFKWLDFPLKLLLVFILDEVSPDSRIYTYSEVFAWKSLKFSYHEHIQLPVLTWNEKKEEKKFIKIKLMLLVKYFDIMRVESKHEIVDIFWANAKERKKWVTNGAAANWFQTENCSFEMAVFQTAGDKRWILSQHYNQPKTKICQRVLLLKNLWAKFLKML